MKKIVCATMALLLLLTGCTTQMPTSMPTESFSQGIYEFTFTVEQVSGEPTDEWDFVYTYYGETITSGHQILFSLELFTFHTIQVKVSERGKPSNEFTASYPVAICAGGSGKTEVTVTATNGTPASFIITCNVTQVGVR